MHRLFTIVTIAGAVALAGCAKKAPLDVTQPASVSGGSQSTGNGTSSGASGTTGAIVAGSNADFVQQMRGRNVILFDTDKFDIDSADATALRAQAEWLQRYPNKRATIEGHCDERGTRDYNLALGERRANAAKNYLVSLGVAATRLGTVSYGKERPAAMGSNEQAWAQNRRAVTLTID
jgi:peptidoglycan-associated lipoprotein